MTMTPEEKSTLEVLAARAKRTRGGECVDTVRGWCFIMSQGMVGLPGTHLSAQLVPKGRSSVDADWHFLGEALAVLGGSPEALLTPFDTTPPNDVHHWHWGAPPDVVERIRAAIPGVKATVKRFQKR
jgi:hypothetical protein